MAAAYIGAYVFQGALKYLGLSNAIVYGVYPATAPLIIVAAAAAGIAATGSGAAARRRGSRSSPSPPAPPSPDRSERGHSPAWAAASRCSATPPPRRSGCAADDGAHMTTDALDPLIHAPARLRILVTLAALHDGDTLSFTRLQDMLELTPGNLITHLRRNSKTPAVSAR